MKFRTLGTSDPFKWQEGVFLGFFRGIVLSVLFRRVKTFLSNNFPDSGNLIVSNHLSNFMQIIPNMLAGMGAVFGLTFVVAISDILVSYVSPTGKTLTEIVTERVVA